MAPPAPRAPATPPRAPGEQVSERSPGRWPLVVRALPTVAPVCGTPRQAFLLGRGNRARRYDQLPRSYEHAFLAAQWATPFARRASRRTVRMSRCTQ